ncbi:MAG: vanadium-dependent haloperoxidase [Acidimicrobiia bacterium]|nr:vanadium-dependent haloperoxidase [Acidimicrobiia bacterium]
MVSSRLKRFMALLVVLVAAAVALGGLTVAGLWSRDPACPPMVDHPEWTVARRWNEALLDAIRQDIPAPTVHARNLFHASAAMWDAWAAFEPEAEGIFVDEEQSDRNVSAARDEAISYAAFRILEARYLDSVGAVETIPEFDALMEALCYPIDVTTTEGDSPAALGNRIARVVLDAGLGDGSNEAEGYIDPDYQPVNPPLVVDQSGTTLIDPNRWQPLRIEEMISQNGIPVENAVQEFVDPHWGFVKGFALPEAGPLGMPIDPGDPPYLGDPATEQAYKEGAVEVIRYSSLLDPAAGVLIDISPRAIGANPLGTTDGSGHPVNPVTGSPYEPVVVNRADFNRAVAEFWADGPHSETPPGHWNTLANAVSDELSPNLKIGGTGPAVDRLEWDVKLYLALNGANHDAAVAAWGTKGYYDYVRPISMIRYLGGLGQSSEPGGPSYDPDGLPLVPDLVEVITEATTTAGRRHAALAGHEGEIAIRAYAGNPPDRESETGGVAWILAADWVPYQAPTFVTPSFAGYVSGHSTFSRASAEVMAAFTGSEFFPGGLGEWTIPAGSLEFEAGPETDVTLQWATYADASDQAGVSRLYGGIHVRADDFAGRVMGAEIGRAAWARAQQYYGSRGDA